MRSLVGFDRKIKLEWLDAIADRAAQESNPTVLRTYLHELLETDHPGEAARKKTVGVVMRIWALVPEEHQPLQQRAFELLRDIPAKDRIWLHWGMTLLAYPLFRDTAASIGRLLKLQNEFTYAQLERRVIDGWGERSTVKRAVQRVVRSMVDWHTLDDIDGPGHFVPSETIKSRSRRLQLWFLAASHSSMKKELIEADELLSLPLSFPFHLSLKKADVKRAAEFDVHRQGLDMDMVAVTPTKTKTKQATLFD